MWIKTDALLQMSSRTLTENPSLEWNSKGCYAQRDISGPAPFLYHSLWLNISSVREKKNTVNCKSRLYKIDFIFKTISYVGLDQNSVILFGKHKRSAKWSEMSPSWPMLCISSAVLSGIRFGKARCCSNEGKKLNGIDVFMHERLRSHRINWHAFVCT